MEKIGYALQALHEGTRKPIAWLSVPEQQAQKIISALWPEENFWSAPSGSSMPISSEAEAQTINSVLDGCGIVFDPEGHYWLFHVYLTE